MSLEELGQVATETGRRMQDVHVVGNSNASCKDPWVKYECVAIKNVYQYMFEVFVFFSSYI